MIIDTSIELYRWVNKTILSFPFKRCRIVLNNGSSHDGYIVASTTTGVFFKTIKEFQDNMMFAEWVPNRCVVNAI